ncbi:ATP-binding protein [Candidatus Palauibacter sp.]|uniref:ATP-binding protein n=1 Tax=Candidatus Palauibacter sp. TaxID=3101350 RepID=UPI003AF1F500
MTAANFGRPGVVAYRNPNLAEAMKALGLVQRYGAGIPIARRELRENGQPEPEFRVNSHWVHCTVGAR